MENEKQKEDKISGQSQRNSAIKKAPSAILVYAYGFDKLGFNLSQIKSAHVGKKAIIKFLPYHDNRRLDDAQGVIIPNGIFYSKVQGAPWIYKYGKNYLLWVDSNKLIQCKHEIENILQSGGWLVFLVRDIIASNKLYSESLGSVKDISQRLENSDLCNMFLSRFNIVPGTISISEVEVNIKDDGFIKYIKEWGTPKTALEQRSKGNQEQKILAESSEHIVGAEFQSKVFFLPFHTLNHTEEELQKITKEVTSAVCDYVQKRRGEIPEWTDQFKFENEKKLNLNLIERSRRSTN